MLYLGQAGWSLSSLVKPAFPGEGTHLERYGGVLRGVEINSSFYRPHQQKTYAKWAASVPPEFRFAVKVPKAITHEGRLEGFHTALERFLGEVSGLEAKLGPLLVQLPPSFGFDAAVVGPFFAALRQQHRGGLVCEARHASWFTAQALALYQSFAIAQAVVDPLPFATARVSPEAQPFLYLRLHGSPQVYYSAYNDEALASYASLLGEVVASGKDAWCIFDNTAAGHALPNALRLKAIAGSRRSRVLR